MKKLLALSVLWMGLTIYNGLESVTLQEDAQFAKDFEDFLVYRHFLNGCIEGKGGMQGCTANDYWACVNKAYEEKAAFRKRMKRDSGK